MVVKLSYNRAKAVLVDKEVMNEIETGNLIVKVKEFSSQGDIPHDIGFINFGRVASLKEGGL